MFPEPWNFFADVSVCQALISTCTFAIKIPGHNWQDCCNCSLFPSAHAWSHLSLDFVTGLSNSQGNTVRLIMVNLFSKTYRFIPSAKQTANIPQDLVPDRGPQFAIWLWRAFYQLLEASMSFSFGFNPESQNHYWSISLSTPYPVPWAGGRSLCFCSNMTSIALLVNLE